MSEQEVKTNQDQWWSHLLFLRLFQGFRMAVQPGKLSVALLGVVVLFLCGWILDALTPGSYRVICDIEAVVNQAKPWDVSGCSDLDAYVEAAPQLARDDLEAYRRTVREQNQARLIRLLEMDLDMKDLANVADIEDGDAKSKVKQYYKENLPQAMEVIAQRYDQRVEALDAEYEKRLENTADKAKLRSEIDRDLAQLKVMRDALIKALLSGQATDALGGFDKALIVVPSDLEGKDRQEAQEKADRDARLIMDTAVQAFAYRALDLAEGRGIFATFADFKMTQLQGLIGDVVWRHDCQMAKSRLYQLALGACWLSRFHPVFALLLMVVGLSVWAVVGGALCRMAALQFAREERIGPWRALQFSMGKFASFFSAPLIPIGIIIFIGLFVFLGGLAGAVPYIGEIAAPLLMGLALFGGFVMALIAIGLIGGMGLMYPTIAVEGSDSFDAISRAFSYLFARPWRLGFYGVVSFVYGGICYLFVRLFAFLLLLAVHVAAGIGMNWDDSAVTVSDMRGKLDAIWPAPMLANLQPSVNWVTLNGTETLGAFFIWIWVSLVVGLVLAFAVSFCFSMQTVIYCLLRKHVDSTDLEDVYVEEDVEGLPQESQPTPEDKTPDDEAADAEAGEKDETPPDQDETDNLEKDE
ncbi:MAG: hypothetical protein JW810_11115 [Sedimentisphaerales bacterium]|nr:hypothetical protein [Sedimentisphaerales bacterium]